jgi:hypothetical protein
VENISALEPVIVLLVVGILAITLMRPRRLSPIVGYVIAGIIIDPQGLGVIEENSTARLLAELGVVCLLFDIGLPFSLAHLRDSRRDVSGLDPLQVALCTAAFGVIALAAGLDPRVAVIIGATLALPHARSCRPGAGLGTDSADAHASARVEDGAGARRGAVPEGAVSDRSSAGFPAVTGGGRRCIARWAGTRIRSMLDGYF